MKDVFKPAGWNWFLTILFGIVVPIAGQAFIAGLVADLNPLPTYNENGNIVFTNPALSVILLSVIFVIYVFVIAYQAWFVVKLKTHNSVWALALTIVLPVIVSVTVPYMLNLVVT